MGTHPGADGDCAGRRYGEDRMSAGDIMPIEATRGYTR